MFDRATNTFYFAKNSIFDVWQGYECISAYRTFWIIKKIYTWQAEMRVKWEIKWNEYFTMTWRQKNWKLFLFLGTSFKWERNIIKLRAKCPFLEFFWSIFSRIRTLKTPNMNAFYPVSISLSQVGVPVK